MLRYLPLIVLLALTAGCTGSFTRIAESEKTVHATAEVPGMSRERILSATRIWMEDNFVTQADPIAFEDRDEGSITGNGQIAYPCSWVGCLTKGDWNVSFAMRVDAQDGLIKTTFRNIQLASPASGVNPVYSSGMNAPVWSRRDMEAIRPKLLELQRELVNDLLANAAGQ